MRDHGCFHTLIDRNTGVVLIRNTSNALGAMREWQERTAGAFQAWETDQTAFDDLLRGRGRGHRRNMTDEQRRDYFEMKKDWCDFPKDITEERTMGRLSELGGRRTAGSRRLVLCVMLDIVPGDKLFVKCAARTARRPALPVAGCSRLARATPSSVLRVLLEVELARVARIVNL